MAMAAATMAGVLPSQMPPQVDFEEIRLEEKVGHGSYGVVFKAMWRDKEVAVKEFGASAEQKAIETEVKQLSRVKHANIIALYAISSYQRATYLIMEYAEGGSLHNFLHGKVQPVYSLAHAMSWSRQCAEGVAYLHGMTPKALIHRDLKPLNLLLTNMGRHLKICDFGTVADKSTMMTNNRGSAAWMAPEVFEGSKYTEKCDIFSWAIVLWEVLSRKQPFKDIDNTYSIMWKIHKGERPPLLGGCPKRIEDLMTDCWKTAPEERPSMKYVVSVMNEIIKDYTGAETPLEYTFVNQQIVTKESDATVAAHYDVLDSSNLCSSASETSAASTQLTPTNDHRPTTTTNTSNSLTPTNLGSNVDNNTYPQMPHVSIVSTNRWDAIPEEDTETTNDSFNTRSSAEAAKRLETIRNDMIRNACTPLPGLTLDVEANGFDLGHSESSSSMPAKSDGKERLTVTDTKPMVTTTAATGGGSAITTTTPTAATAGLPLDQTNNNSNISNHNNNNNSSSSSNNNNDNNDGSSDDNADENDSNDQSLAEMLDPELQPEPPIPNNAESQAIYRDHRHMAKQYLRVDTSLYYAQDFKDKLIVQMDSKDCARKQELLRKMRDKEDLQSVYNSLKQQLEKMPAARQAQAATSLLRVSSNPEPQTSPGHNNSSSGQTNGSENVCEDDWVVIATQQHT